MSSNRLIQAVFNRFEKVADYLFGYDFFISYAHLDGELYPIDLCNKLKSLNFSVFLDKENYHAGIDLKKATRRRVKMSRYLIVVGAENAMRSTWVKEEINIFISKNKYPILINVNKAFQELDENDPLEIKGLLKDRIYINEISTVENTSPSQDTIGNILKSFNGLRQETLRIRVIAIAAFVFFLAAVAIARLTVEAVSQRKNAIAERNRALEELVRKELAEIRLLRDAPLDHERTRRIQHLLKRLAPINFSSVADSVRDLYQKIPAVKNLKSKINTGQWIIALAFNNRSDSIAIAGPSGIEIRATQNLKKWVHKFSISDIPGRSKSSTITWATKDAAENKVYFEITYDTYAMESLEKDLYWLDNDTYPSFDMDGIEKLVESERELFSIGYNGTGPTFEAITRNVSTIRQMNDALIPIEYSARGKSVPKEEFFKMKTKDKSNEVEAELRKRTEDSIKYLSVKFLAADLQTGAGLYEVVTLAERIPGRVHMGGMVRQPYIYTFDRELTPVDHKVAFQQGNAPISELGFSPAALSQRHGVVFLNNSLIKCSPHATNVITNLNLALEDVVEIRFTSDGKGLIIIMKEGDIRVTNLETNKTHTFLAINAREKAHVSPDGKLVYLISWNGEVEVWDLTAFGEDGWAKR